MQKTIALVAHDHNKPDLVKWSLAHKTELTKYKLVATGTTGGILQKELDLDIHCFKSGPLGGDQQIGALIAEGKLDCLIFFWDPLNPLLMILMSKRYLGYVLYGITGCLQCLYS